MVPSYSIARRMLSEESVYPDRQYHTWNRAEKDGYQQSFGPEPVGSAVQGDYHAIKAANCNYSTEVSRNIGTVLATI